MWTSVLPVVLASASLGALPQDDLRARDAVIARMEYVLDQAKASASLDGLAVVVQSGDDVWWSKGFGWLDARAQRAARPEASLAGGALLPPLTALAIAKLADAKKLRLDDEVSKWFPELSGERPTDLGGARAGERSPEHGERSLGRAGLTLRQVLAHASGLPACDAWVDARSRAGTPTTREDVLAWLAGEPLDFAPGTCFAFSSSDVLVAGWIVERVAEKDFASFVRTDLCGELRLDTLRRTHVPEAGERFAEAWGEAGGELASLGRTGALLGADTLTTSALDLARLARGAARGSIVSDDVWRELATPFALANGQTRTQGLGFDLACLGEFPTVGFGGSAYGACLHATYYPEYDLAIALVAPGERASLDLVERRLARVFLDLAEPEVLDLPLARDERAPLLGGYYVGCNRAVVSEEEGRLYLSLPERERLALFYQGAHAFVVEGDAERSLEFEVRDGRAERFVLEDRGSRTVGVRMD
ncbi:MAG: beta-lactamase family protein [Planctomycetes bacterium]|nr:beta-lactamase family protein [Planctomycetota bacterium]